MSRLDIKEVGEDGINNYRYIGSANVYDKNVWNNVNVLLGEMECRPLAT